MTTRPLSDRECHERFGLPRWGYEIMRYWFTDEELRLYRQPDNVIEMEVERLKRLCEERRIGPAYQDARL